MKSKLITSLLLAAAFAFAPAVNAADDEKKEKNKPAAAKKGKKSKKERGLPGALGKLELSADQKKEVLALMKDTSAKRKEAVKDKDKDKDKIREIQKAHQAKLAEILGKEKVAELKELNAEARKARDAKKGEDKKKKKKE